jgi:hypothetical protein
MIVIVNEHTPERWTGNWDEFVRDNIESIPWEMLTKIHERISSGEVAGETSHGAGSGWSIRKADTFPLHSVGHTLVDNGMAYATSFPPKDFDELISFHVSNIEWGSGDDFTEALSAEDKATIERISKTSASRYLACNVLKYNEEWR